MKKLLFVLPILAIIIVWCSKTPVVVEPQIEVIEDVENLNCEFYVWWEILTYSQCLERRKEISVWLEVCAYFTEEFIDKYQYEDSKWYNFALKIDWYYYNVFRVRYY